MTGPSTASAARITVGGTVALLVGRSAEAAQAVVLPGTLGGPVMLETDTGERLQSRQSFVRVNPGPPALAIEGRLAAPASLENASFGAGLALNASGQVLLAGAPDRDGGLGAAAIFERDHQGDWQQTSATLVDATARTTGGCQGLAAALDAVGAVATVGGPCTDGSTWTYAKDVDGGWGVVPRRTDGQRGAMRYEALSVALSAGATVMATSIANGGGGAWVVEGADPGAWGPRQRLALPIASTGYLSSAVVVSATGRVVAVNATPFPPNTASAWVFERSDAGWAPTSPQLTGTDPVGVGRSHTAMSMSADGRGVVLLSLRPSDTDAGVPSAAAWVFRRGDDGRWQQDGPRLNIPPALGFGTARQGLAVDFEATRFIVAGALTVGGGVGVLAYARQDGGWAPATDVVVLGDGGPGPSNNPPRVALSLDGRTIAVGSPADDRQRGAVYLLRW